MDLAAALNAVVSAKADRKLRGFPFETTQTVHHERYLDDVKRQHVAERRGLV